MIQKKVNLFLLIVVSIILAILSCVDTDEDGIKPTLSTVQVDSIYPEKGTNNVNIDKNIRIYFDGQLDKTSKEGTIKLNNETIDSDRISINDFVITISPSPNWRIREKYESISVSGFKALNGTTIKKYEDTTYNFTTRDDTVPTPLDIQSTFPADKATNIDVGITIRINFTIDLLSSQKGSVTLGNITFPSSNITISGNSILVNTGNLLDYDTPYTGLEISGFKTTASQSVDYNLPNYSFRTKAQGSVVETTLPSSSTATTLEAAPAGSIYLTRVYIEGLGSAWQNQKLILAGDGLGGYTGWTYEAAPVKGTVSNSGIFEYTFPTKLSVNIDFLFTGVRLNGSDPAWNDGKIGGGTVGNNKDVGITNPKDTKTYYIKCNADNWSWTLELEGGNTTTPTTPPTTPTSPSGPTTTVTYSPSIDWRDQIIYFIMTDRFYDGDSGNNPVQFTNKSSLSHYHGGDLKGIMDKVEYIKAMGATAIWITPVVSNVRSDGGYRGGYTGYWASDHSILDETLAPNGYNAIQRFDYYKNFVDTMHNNGLLVIQDIVVNHMGPVLKYDNGWDVDYYGGQQGAKFIETALGLNTSGGDGTFGEQKRGIPAAPFNNLNYYHRMGRIKNYDGGDQERKGDLLNLADIYTEDSEVRDHFIRIYSDWLNAGVDGYRIDTVKHVEEDFWSVFCPGIRLKANALGKSFIQFGEALNGDHDFTAKYSSPNRLDSMLNFNLYYQMQSVFTGWESMGKLKDELETRKNAHSRGPIYAGGAGLSAWEAAVNFIDNHDVARFMNSTNGDASKMRNALMYLMTTQGIPCIYYNTENDTYGSDDTDGRRDMPNFNMPNSNAGAPNNTKDVIAKLSKIRKESVALRRGDMVINRAEGDIIVFTRTSVNETVVVAINKGGGQQSANIPQGNYTDLYNGGTVNGTSVNVPSRGCAILKKN